MMEYSLDNETYGTSVPTGKNAGNYTIYYREVDAESDPLSLTASIATKTVSSPTITLSETSYIYDGTVADATYNMGEDVEPEVTVMDGDTEIPTEEYIVNYSDNINVGTATVTITNNTGGNYIVSGSTSFNIVREISVFIGSNLWAGYVAAEDLAIPTGLEAYVITNLGTTTATASPLDYIPQGEPVLLKRDDTTISSYEAMPGTGTAPTMNLLKAYDTDKSLSNREGFILYNDEFVLVNEGTLPAGRVFLPANNALLSRGLTRSIEIDDDNATGIEDNKMFVDDADGQWFDLQGRRLEKKPTKKGLYILKGRKVIVK